MNLSERNMFQVGDRVINERYGKGTVVLIDRGNEEKFRNFVWFDDLGEPYVFFFYGDGSEHLPEDLVNVQPDEYGDVPYQTYIKKLQSPSEWDFHLSIGDKVMNFIYGEGVVTNVTAKAPYFANIRFERFPEAICVPKVNGRFTIYFIDLGVGEDSYIFKKPKDAK